MSRHDQASCNEPAGPCEDCGTYDQVFEYTTDILVYTNLEECETVAECQARKEEELNGNMATDIAQFTQEWNDGQRVFGGVEYGTLAEILEDTREDYEQQIRDAKDECAELEPVYDDWLPVSSTEQCKGEACSTRENIPKDLLTSKCTYNELGPEVTARLFAAVAKLAEDDPFWTKDSDGDYIFPSGTQVTVYGIPCYCTGDLEVLETQLGVSPGTIPTTTTTTEAPT